MLFDLQPKTRREDLYDREKELLEFRDALSLGERLLLLLGIRRLGKSSLLNVALRESGFPCAKLDVRSLYFTHGSIPQETLAKRILDSLLESLSAKHKLQLGLEKALSSIKGIRISGIHVEFEKKPDLAELLEKLDSWAEKEGTRVILAFDEAQYLRLSGIQYDGMIAYAVDNLSNLTFVLTGSEVGMLHDFLGLDNPKKPLFGRYAREIILERFTREQSEDFLRKGFEELDFKVTLSEIENAVNRLDGIVGWLTMYGYLRGVRKLSEKDALNELFRKAHALVRDELSSLLSFSRRYGFILKAVALGNHRWSEIKDYVEVKSGHVNDAKFSALLKNLVKYGYLIKTERGYEIPDPVVSEVVKTL
ncbi:ATP-binding protein [Thermococcus sp. SY098]|uniref:AAA family ATPase n=1 Tax=Thermococcus sp. SY098 TaxID=3111325 RepID=UPI002D789834|nr:ATP-binding protein [Thermococcus sp. SY098]WRS53417.1 ATP-binding protein [Thermococcus sp. SY098]